MEGRSKPKKCESFRNSRNVPWKSCSGTTKKGNYKKPMMSESSAERKDTLIGEVSERYIVMSSTNPMPITLERILSTKNINKAIVRVERNKGAAGIDGMRTDEIRTYCKEHPYEISRSVLNGTYTPQPILRVYIPKDNGDQRPLGIPTVIDRVVQQAVAQVLSEEWEKEFSENSFGFRPGRGCHDAIQRVSDYLNQGKIWIVDLDLSKFFDTVNHSKLLQILSDKIKDGRVISLIHKFLRAPVCENGKVGNKNTIGTPQGGCISPVLANILLNELDQMLDKEGICFSRYADDMMILCNSKYAAERVLKRVTMFVEKTLFLKVNQEKTKIGKASPEMKFLGFGFTNEADDKNWPWRPKDGKWFSVVHQKAIKKLKDAAKKTLNRKGSNGIERVAVALANKLRGWVNYFQGGISDPLRKTLDGWLRRHIRQLYWKTWKTMENRIKWFRKLWPTWGAPPTREDYAYGSNRYWRMSKTHQIHIALSNRTLADLGWSWISLFDY